MTILEVALKQGARRQEYVEAQTVATQFGKVLRGSLNPGQVLLLDDMQKALARETSMFPLRTRQAGFRP